MTAIFYPDCKATSDNGRFTLEARSPHNGTIPHRDGRKASDAEFGFKYRQHQSEFRYQLLDNTRKRLLAGLFGGDGRRAVWERWQTRREDSPGEVVVSDDGWAVSVTSAGANGGTEAETHFALVALVSDRMLTEPCQSLEPRKPIRYPLLNCPLTFTSAGNYPPVGRTSPPAPHRPMTTAAASTFKTHEPALHELLEGIHKGDIQLPDFQRGWVWDDDRIRALIASVSVSYPIGVVMLLETGGEGVRFLPRPFEGAPTPAPTKPQKLVLDGQQRLTSLYMSLRSGKPVPTTTAKGEKIHRVYYLDMNLCLDDDADRVDAVRSLPPDRMLKSNFDRTIDLDVSTRGKEYEHGLVPLDIFFDVVAYNTWKAGYLQKYAADPTRFKLLLDFDAQVWQRFFQYRVPVIELVRETPKAAVCQVFEKVNTGGVALTVFELVTASFAADDFQLRRDWDERKKRLNEHAVLGDLDSSDLLAAVTLLTTYQKVRATGKGAIRCRREDILRLELSDYKRNAPEVEKGYVRAAKLLVREKVYDTRTLPYQGQLIPLAAICTALGDRFEQDAVKRKLARWYWCGVFGELYGGANEARFANDLPDVLAWLDGGDEPKTVRDSTFAPMRLLTLQTRLSAAYKGVMARLMQVGSRDFLSGDAVELNTYFETAIDIHHIFPKAHCEKQGYDSRHWNSVVNKGPLSARTNRIIGGYKPSTYLTSLTKNHAVTEKNLDEILTTHLVNPQLLRADDFAGFIRERAARLLSLIEDATGKPVAGRDSAEVIETFGGALSAVLVEQGTGPSNGSVPT